jgi:hypothetical protein
MSEDKSIVTGGIMRQRIDTEEFVTPKVCDLHHQLMEEKLTTLRQKDQALEDKITGVEKQLITIGDKIDRLVNMQESQTKYLLWIAVGIILTLLGVLAGRVVDFSWLL